jgi:hypothetical protein
VIRASRLFAGSSACCKGLPLQFHTELREARRHDAERSQEGEPGRPARVLFRIGVEYVEDIDESCDAAVSIEMEAFLHRISRIVMLSMRRVSIGSARIRTLLS